MAKQASMDDDDPDAYKELPGDTKGKRILKHPIIQKVPR